MRYFQRSLLFTLITVLAGCAVNNGIYQPTVEDRSEPRENSQVIESVEPAVTAVVVKPTIIKESRTEQFVSPPVPATVATRTRPPAVAALLKSAQDQKLSGATRAAQSSLERAQRIAPRDPEVYYQLADLKRFEGYWVQAEQLALKGTNIATGDSAMLRRLWLLIADIRQSSGNASAAQKARAQASRY